MQISKIKMYSFGSCHFWEDKCTLSISLQNWDLDTRLTAAGLSFGKPHFGSEITLLRVGRE